MTILLSPICRAGWWVVWNTPKELWPLSVHTQCPCVWIPSPSETKKTRNVRRFFLHWPVHVYIQWNHSTWILETCMNRTHCAVKKISLGTLYPLPPWHFTIRDTFFRLKGVWIRTQWDQTPDKPVCSHKNSWCEMWFYSYIYLCMVIKQTIFERVYIQYV